MGDQSNLATKNEETYATKSSKLKYWVIGIVVFIWAVAVLGVYLLKNL